jgi:hypothetical protein
MAVPRHCENKIVSHKHSRCGFEDEGCSGEREADGRSRFIPSQEKYIRDPDIIVAELELRHNVWQRGGDNRIFQGAQESDYT